jgi:hypothetical protein
MSPMPYQLPMDFWQGEHDLLVKLIQPRLQGLAAAGIIGAEKKLNALGIYFDNSLVHEQAAKWARAHTDEILAQFETRTQGMVGEKIAAWIETPGQNIGQLVDMLKPVLDQNAARAWAVAVTETTRAYSEGNDIAYQAVGIPGMAFKPPSHPQCRCTSGVRRLRSKNQWVVVWYTERDSLVCKRPIKVPWGEVAGCGGLHGVIISQGEYLGRKFSEVEAE